MRSIAGPAQALFRDVKSALQRPSCLVLPTLTSPITRHLASSTSKPAKSRQNPRDGKPRGGGATFKRFIPHETQKFYKQSGQLLTTDENVDFFQRYPNLEPDNGKLVPLKGGPELRDVTARYGIRVAFSPRHILHPHHLVYFDPRGHPLTPSIRAKYARKTTEEPLWAVSVGFMTGSAVVSMLPRRTIKGSVFRRLEELGYKNGVAEGKEIRGTLWLMLLDPLKTVQYEADGFGRVVADVLDQRYSRRTD